MMQKSVLRRAFGPIWRASAFMFAFFAIFLYSPPSTHLNQLFDAREMPLGERAYADVPGGGCEAGDCYDCGTGDCSCASGTGGSGDTTCASDSDCACGGDCSCGSDSGGDTGTGTDSE